LTDAQPRRLILRNFQSPGDVLMLTAAVRDLHRAAPGRFMIDVRTSCPALWENNPHLTPLGDGDVDVETMDVHYPLIHQSNHLPVHFLHGMALYLAEKVGIGVPVTEFRGDVYLTEAERRAPSPAAEAGAPERYWVIVAGGKRDFTAKWWSPVAWQAVVDALAGRVRFVQVGEAGHHHPPLQGVTNLIGRTNTRDLMRLIHHADGVLCGVTFAMHLAAAVPPAVGRPPHRACVVVAGGREPPHWEAYPHHQFMHTVGALPCCAHGGCWKSRCQLVGDGDAKDTSNLCERPVQVTADLRVPQCMDMIRPADVVRRIELYYEGGSLAWPRQGEQTTDAPPAAPPAAPAPPKEQVRVQFHHGLGDCVYAAHLMRLYRERGHGVLVGCTPDKAVLFGLAGCETTQEPLPAHAWGYPAEGTHVGQGRFWQGSKPGNGVSAPPLPDIGDRQQLWQELVNVRIDSWPHLPAESRATAERWLAGLRRPVVLMHSKGNTGQGGKNLPDATTDQLYKHLIDRTDGSLVLLDWDRRVPRLPSWRVRHLDDLGACATDTLLALIGRADLLVGVDSGPLHAARFTDTKALGLWMPGHYPSTYSLPRGRQANAVLGDHTRAWNRYKRVPWNLIEQPGGAFDAGWIADQCVRLLAGPRYLDPDVAGLDLVLQQWVGWCRGAAGVGGEYHDRHRSFDVLLREMLRRFDEPTVVETGCIRAEEDWPGAGFFTYLMGAYLSRSGGTLYSVDVSPENCAFARAWTGPFGDTVRVHQESSERFLSRFAGRIDVLYLDSLDTTEPGHAEYALKELEAALPRLHKESIVAVDDSPWRLGAWTGKGARVIPYLLERDWEILYAGYQCVLSRKQTGEEGR
jgi:ADP-heptose:LPS heptosyltransferase